MSTPRNNDLARKVLLLETRFPLALARARTLQRLGCRVLGPAGSASEAVDLLDRARPDLALLDPKLPKRQLARVIAALESCDVPSAFIVSDDDEPSFGHPALPDAAFSPNAAPELERLLGQLLS
ncbi:hypothetical protein [Benzoatithermus flavus]|uniref:Response regulatory domain-containing protein n=1 Tax=Benzoatithermus flavus TaxID=3108223 RepID=A0ABU8XZP1_9PROT